jgi:hypothetical protein
MNFFYNRTAYRLLDSKIPVCFVALDVYFGKKNSDYIDKKISLAENICRRMSDIEYFAFQIKNNLAQKRDIWDDSVLIGTLLTSLYGSYKSLFDATAITLNYIYELGLTPKEQDFNKPVLWKRLQSKSETLHKRYFLFKDLSREVSDWRDAAIHRVTPIVMPVGPGDPGKIPINKFDVKLFNQKGMDLVELVNEKVKPNFVEPLYHYEKWHDQLLKICEEICKDIEISYDSGKD